MRQNRRKQLGGGLFARLFCAILFYEKVLPDLRLNQLVQSQVTLRSLTSRVYRFALRLRWERCPQPPLLRFTAALSGFYLNSKEEKIRKGTTMDSFVFALDTTMPVFLVILLGWFLRRVGILNEGFCKPADQYVFKCALPVSLFLSIAKMDVYSDFDPAFCLFCFTVTAVVFLGVWALTSRLMKDKALIGEFSQAAVRSSAAILGVALSTNIYGDAGMVPMMVLSAVPFFNVYAVLILQFSPHVDENGRLIAPERDGGAAVKRALCNVAKNPIILGILLGVPFSLLRVKLPTILSSTLNTIGGTATPVALLAVGASFSSGEAAKCVKPALLATAIKLFILPAFFLPIAAMMGFTGSAMIAILIMVGSPTTVSCYVMAKNMGYKGVLTSSVVMLATVLSSVSLTLWIFLLRLFGLL